MSSMGLRNLRGFTLVELLIVVIILGILAAAALPQFSSSTEDAKLSTLQSNLGEMRNAIELYYHQHNSRYPGAYKETDGTTASANAADAQAAFVAQLTQYTDVNGKVNGVKTAVYKFGPYLKKFALPNNPFLAGAVADDILADIVEDDVTVAPTASGAGGWKFYTKIGRFIADDNLTLSDGVTKTIDQ